MKRYLSAILVVIVIAVAVGSFVYAFVLNQTLSVDNYKEVCEENGLAIYKQEASEDSLAGVTSGYTATSGDLGIQLDFYNFQNKSDASKALKRIVGWVAVHKGERGINNVIKNDSWVMQTDNFYCQVVMYGKTVVCVSCEKLENMQQAKDIISKVLED